MCPTYHFDKYVTKVGWMLISTLESHQSIPFTWHSNLCQNLLFVKKIQLLLKQGGTV